MSTNTNTHTQQIAELIPTDRKLFFFWGLKPNNSPLELGPWVLSNFHPVEMDDYSYQGFTYKKPPTSEHLFMWSKAIFFGDRIIAAKIMQTNSPKEAKHLGRKVSNYNDAQWSLVRVSIMTSILKHKFKAGTTQHDYLRSFKEGTMFVEASPYDKIWGIGLDMYDQRSREPDQWLGKNLLGYILTRLHISMREGDV